MNKSQKLDIMIIRAKMKSEESIAKMVDAWFGEELEVEEGKDGTGIERAGGGLDSSPESQIRG